MRTPIYDFVRRYAEGDAARLHMPGLKGVPFLGCEPYDITEIAGADVLSGASGIIRESEENATRLFGTAATYYMTEGSTQGIKAMLALATAGKKGARILAARNAHRAFVHAACLLDLEVKWLYPEEEAHLCTCRITPEALAQALDGGEMPTAVYVTSPDYLGEIADIAALAAVCRARGVPLLVDNAHGAYLRWLSPALHPILLGATMCCDSAHKTLPVLTGGAYLHIARGAERYLPSARSRLALFASTSPSYLTLASLDLCNRYLADGYAERLAETVARLDALRAELRELGYTVVSCEPLKLVLRADGEAIAAYLGERGISVEFADREYLVLMVTPETRENELRRLCEALAAYPQREAPQSDAPAIPRGERVLSIREAILAEHEICTVADAVGRIAAAPTVSCPPAVPIAVSGERITPEVARALAYYGVTAVEVVAK